MKHFIEIKDTSIDELKGLLQLSSDLKRLYKSGKRDLCLDGKILAMLFEKASLRTRMSFQVAMIDLGGNAIYLHERIGQREPAKDMARVISRYTHGIMARTYAHQTIHELAEYSDVPVINALSDYSHPCQAMADLLTIQEHCGQLEGIKLAYVGDGNNVARSLAFACAKFNMRFVVAAPEQHQLDEESLKLANDITPGCAVAENNPNEAVQNADVIYTDTWVSMGQEEEKQQRLKDFQGYQVNMNLLSNASKNVKVMHCLPAYRECEITDEVAESEHSIIFDQAENRLHFQRALLKELMS